MIDVWFDNHYLLFSLWDAILLCSPPGQSSIVKVAIFAISKNSKFPVHHCFAKIKRLKKVNPCSSYHATLIWKVLPCCNKMTNYTCFGRQTQLVFIIEDENFIIIEYENFTEYIPPWIWISQFLCWIKFPRQSVLPFRIRILPVMVQTFECPSCLLLTQLGCLRKMKADSRLPS